MTQVVTALINAVTTIVRGITLDPATDDHWTRLFFGLYHLELDTAKNTKLNKSTKKKKRTI